jgi:hypothetical protein
MATIRVGVPTGSPNTVLLSSAQTGNGASTNVADTGGTTGPALLTIVSTVGATPTVTVAIQGSVDGGDWFSIAYADTGTPETVSVATFAITTATTTRKILRPKHPWRYLRLDYSANTNVTLTSNLFVFAD